MSATPLVARLQLIGSAVLFSTGGAAIKSCQLTDWQVASFRCAVAGLALVVLFPAARRALSGRAALVGCAFAGTLIAYSIANKATTAASAIFLQSTAPLYVLVLGPFLLGEKTKRRDLLLMVALAGGLALVLMGLNEPLDSAPQPMRGATFGTAAGVFWALTVLGLRWLESGRDAGRGAGLAAVVLGNAIGFVVALPFALPVTTFRVDDAWWILYLGLIQIALAYVLLVSGLRRVPAFEASLLLLAEPVFAPLFAWWFHSEVPTLWVIAGGATILAATTVKTWFDVRKPSPSVS
ncbi:MAG: EamA family transporter [Acidobacteriota bacterium]